MVLCLGDTKHPESLRNRGRERWGGVKNQSTMLGSIRKRIRGFSRQREKMVRGCNSAKHVFKWDSRENLKEWEKDEGNTFSLVGFNVASQTTWGFWVWCVLLYDVVVIDVSYRLQGSQYLKMCLPWSLKLIIKRTLCHVMLRPLCMLLFFLNKFLLNCLIVC